MNNTELLKLCIRLTIILFAMLNDFFMEIFVRQIMKIKFAYKNLTVHCL